MSDTIITRTFPSDRLQATTASNPRRTTHGSAGWTLPSGLAALRQPQDGALTNGGTNASVLIRATDGRTSGAIAEAEDAQLNGSLRSLARRVKGLNVMSERPATASRTDGSLLEPGSRKVPETNRKTATSSLRFA